jgi:hypothetical protein
VPQPLWIELPRYRGARGRATAAACCRFPRRGLGREVSRASAGAGRRPAVRVGMGIGGGSIAGASSRTSSLPRKSAVMNGAHGTLVVDSDSDNLVRDPSGDPIHRTSRQAGESWLFPVDPALRCGQSQPRTNLRKTVIFSLEDPAPMESGRTGRKGTGRAGSPLDMPGWKPGLPSRATARVENRSSAIENPASFPRPGAGRGCPRASRGCRGSSCFGC